MTEKQELFHREPKAESRESKEDSQFDRELKAAAAMERADFLSREVKTNQKQVQNIMIHLQQVLAAIKTLRAQLDLPISDEASSVEEDTRRVMNLKKMISEYCAELESLRPELIREQTELLITQNPSLLPSQAEAIALEKIERLYVELAD